MTNPTNPHVKSALAPATFSLTGQPPRRGWVIDEVALHRVSNALVSVFARKNSQLRIEAQDALNARATCNQVASEIAAIRDEIVQRERLLREQIDAEVVAIRRPLESRVSELAAQVAALQQSTLTNRKRRPPGANCAPST